MIVSRPKRNTIFALTLSTAICVFGSVYQMNAFLKSDSPTTWQWAALIFLLLCSSILLYKLFFSYKVIKISHDQVHIYFPFRFFRTSQDIKNLGAWQETIVITNKTEFKQLKLVFLNKGYVKLSNKENSDYDKVYKFIKRKAPKKEVKE